MRVVLIHRYFWPGTPPYAHTLGEIAHWPSAAGHDAQVFTCQPSYNRSVGGVRSLVSSSRRATNLPLPGSVSRDTAARRSRGWSIPLGGASAGSCSVAERAIPDAEVGAARRPG